jgi:hypothetical protein
MDRDMFMRYFGSRIGHTMPIYPTEEDAAMDEDMTHEDEGTSAGVSQLTDHCLLEELRQMARCVGEWDATSDREDMELDSESDAEGDEDDCMSVDGEDDSDSDDGEDDGDDDGELGPEDGEDPGYLDTGYGAL